MACSLSIVCCQQADVHLGDPGARRLQGDAAAKPPPGVAAAWQAQRTIARPGASAAGPAAGAALLSVDVVESNWANTFSTPSGAVPWERRVTTRNISKATRIAGHTVFAF
jgi:hypothetical protein